jgi:hypothetical protein
MIFIAAVVANPCAIGARHYLDCRRPAHKTRLRRALLEVHVDVSTAGIPHHLGITLLPGRGIANPSSTMPGCRPLRVESQDGGDILAVARGHLPSASEDVAVGWAVATLDAVDQCTECR